MSIANTSYLEFLNAMLSANSNIFSTIYFRVDTQMVSLHILEDGKSRWDFCFLNFYFFASCLDFCSKLVERELM